MQTRTLVVRLRVAGGPPMIEVLKITDRDEWLRWRANDLTASDIGAAAGLDHHKSPLALYAEKTGMLLP